MLIRSVVFFILQDSLPSVHGWYDCRAAGPWNHEIQQKIKVFGNDAPAINRAMVEAGIPQSEIPKYLHGQNEGRSLLDISLEFIAANTADTSDAATKADG